MKKAILLTYIIFSIVSCSSDQLSKSKAKDIINECLETKPDLKFIDIDNDEFVISEAVKDSKKIEEGLKKLAEDGFLNIKLMDKKNSIWAGNKYYKVSHTDKADEFVIESYTRKGKTAFKTFEYIVDEILEIHEIPAVNMAEVKVKFKASELTPFINLSLVKPKENYIKTVKFTKTNGGWKYCDKSIISN